VTAEKVAGRLVAVNVGLPQDVDWHGRTVHTGVWKHAVTGPRMVRTLNVDGDGQGDLAGHGGPHRAVLVYQLASYEHWQREFGRDDFEYGQFGENFTVDGLPDDEVCIGDRYEIGGALFEVSAPRVTCYRVGLRLGQPRLPSLLVSHHRPGFYLRVLREGQVEAGDPIVQVGAGAERMSVADIDALLYLPGHRRSDIARALRVPALSPGWQASFRAMLDAPEGSSGNVGLSAEGDGPAPAWSGFRPLRIVDVVPESGTVVSIRLAAPDGAPLPAALPGQFVTLRLPLGDGQPAVSRSYSLSSTSAPAAYRVSVKREPHGVVSAHIHTHLHAGDSVDVAAPRGRFVLQPGDVPVVLLSAGIGATPVLAMLHALAQQRSGRQVWWLHGARNGTEHPFAAEVRALLAALPHARSRVRFSAPSPSDRIGEDYDSAGRLTAAFLQAQRLPVDGDAYICGPASFMAEMREALVGLGVDPARVRSEVFGAGPAQTPGIAAGRAVAPHQPPGPPGEGAAVTFARSGLTVRWRPDFASLLELAEACDVPTRWSCRTGVCHSCEVGLVAGRVDYDPPPIDLPADGSVLVCCSAPAGEVVVDL
jgi:ferredoxin-NADP reductase/MOSC domain-containing protein YiiM